MKENKVLATLIIAMSFIITAPIATANAATIMLDEGAGDGGYSDDGNPK
ncbi:hypothetical protein [Furfurilactobacillus entadae]